MYDSNIKTNIGKELIKTKIHCKVQIIITEVVTSLKNYDQSHLNVVDSCLTKET